jgi:hypothetical protein
MESSLPSRDHRQTVLGSTRNKAATSAGVSKGSSARDRAAAWEVDIRRGLPSRSGGLAAARRLGGAAVTFTKLLPLREVREEIISQETGIV